MTLHLQLRVIIIDDEEPVGRRARQWLSAAHYDATSYTDPAQALAAAPRLPADAAIVDLRMPERSGVEVIAELRRSVPRCVILAMTAFPEAAQVIEAFRAGADDLIEKPLGQESLCSALERLFARAGIVARDEDAFNRWLGGRLRIARQATERSLREVAEQAGITESQLSQIELGRSATSTWTLARVCAALKTPLARVLNHDGPV